ncbi:uncharacterized protein BP01DRAFT_424906 [Aspergillus saccharolyticus JOP 1030-1]|uniref:Uncharacterized protein n=1 Tax=Aspergillus saccharolyticus JOP 1030-1 TaxID=1450539 RepID=A0A318ZFE7_9EURO|nr:hypothetical protein BP01DRAFT_424906 [Aspergillus saccharolyticus JOP 1030-1]PYH43363.1 hypothetical protein BP01DRAFT_424906 [Aspergillus saccharolyticus JOP 1030-1]
MPVSICGQADASLPIKLISAGGTATGFVGRLKSRLINTSLLYSPHKILILVPYPFIALLIVVESLGGLPSLLLLIIHLLRTHSQTQGRFLPSLVHIPMITDASSNLYGAPCTE